MCALFSFFRVCQCEASARERETVHRVWTGKMSPSTFSVHFALCTHRYNVPIDACVLWEFCEVSTVHSHHLFALVPKLLNFCDFCVVGLLFFHRWPRVQCNCTRSSVWLVMFAMKMTASLRSKLNCKNKQTTKLLLTLSERSGTRLSIKWSERWVIMNHHHMRECICASGHCCGNG